MTLAKLLPADASAERKVEFDGYICLIQSELANRVVEGRMDQQLPEKVEDYNA
jgi:hypothetical protein